MLPTCPQRSRKRSLAPTRARRLAVPYSRESSTKTYNAANQIATETNARGVVTSYTYDELTGRLTAIAFSAEDTPGQQFTYNFLGQLIQVEDAAGSRTFSYDKFGSLMDEKSGEDESQVSRYEILDAYGRSIGYSLIRGVELLQLVSTDYAADGRISKASFMDAEGSEQKFTYAYLPGSDLLQTLTQPNGVTLTQSYEEKRNLLTDMLYSHGENELTRRAYTYDALGRPTERQSTQQDRDAITDNFGYNQRSELTSAQVSGELYGYDYDNIGNRRLAFGGADYAVYTANELNQYTKIDTNGNEFTPKYDADGNQTLVQTGTGIWKVAYNAQNRAIRFENEDSNTIIECAYDYMGRRFEKKVTTGGAVTLHERYIYRGYLQIAAVDLLTNTTKHAILWDPTQPIATRPLAIQQGKEWYSYAWDLTKNIIAIFTPTADLSTTYTYTPFGKVTADGDVEQPVQWSSEYHDPELALVYYNYRYYNPTDGRWTRRDPNAGLDMAKLYDYANNESSIVTDRLGLSPWSQNAPSVQDTGSFDYEPSNDPRCACCNKYIASEIDKHAGGISILKSKGCNLKIETVYEMDHPGAAQNYGYTILIRFACESLSFIKRKNAFTHEFQHAEDYCNKTIAPECYGSLCSEITAYTRAEFKGQNLQNPIVKEKVRKRVLGSVKVYNNGIKGCITTDNDFNTKFDELYDKCIYKG